MPHRQRQLEQLASASFDKHFDNIPNRDEERDAIIEEAALKCEAAKVPFNWVSGNADTGQAQHHIIDKAAAAIRSLKSKK